MNQTGEATVARHAHAEPLSGQSGTWGKGGSRQSPAHRSRSVAGGPSAFVAPEMIHPPSVDTLAPKHLAQSKVRMHSDSIESCA